MIASGENRASGITRGKEKKNRKPSITRYNETGVESTQSAASRNRNHSTNNEIELTPRGLGLALNGRERERETPSLLPCQKKREKEKKTVAHKRRREKEEEERNLVIVCSPSFRVLYGPCRLSTFTPRRFATPAHVKYITLKRAGARKGRGRMSSADSFSSINCTPGNKPPPLIGSELARRPLALRGPIAPNYPTCISRSPQRRAPPDAPLES